MLAAAALLATLALTPAQKPDGGVPFTAVAEGSRAAEMRVAPESIVVRSEHGWRSVWKRLGAPAKRPKVDFSRYMLIAVTQGRQGGGGHVVRVSHIERTAHGRHVTVVETEPGEGCFVTLAITAPYQVVRVRRSSSRVTFERQRAVTDC